MSHSEWLYSLIKYFLSPSKNKGPSAFPPQVYSKQSWQSNRKWERQSPTPTPLSYYGGQLSPKFDAILLPQFPKHWDNGCMSPCMITAAMMRPFKRLLAFSLWDAGFNLASGRWQPLTVWQGLFPKAQLWFWHPLAQAQTLSTAGGCPWGGTWTDSEGNLHCLRGTKTSELLKEGIVYGCAPHKQAPSFQNPLSEMGPPLQQCAQGVTISEFGAEESVSHSPSSCLPQSWADTNSTQSAHTTLSSSVLGRCQ